MGSSIPDSPRAQKYRDQAKKFREQAKTASPDFRAQLLELASQYDLLADSVEREAKRGGSG
jgi:hypothetical protein